ncbi:Asp-tRNA(Asn)/Glu-tRNA(Gln) amidotransferase GatCAB subunit A [Candidatus Shapirobacteria bacterium CG_4_9_14_0_2_um_filter_39_11]|uniref:Glutamyl-tRNA(Gln) amidotransferase subunit A n=1 Tax=Candidatus Shapirobacteria bacterium CG_4_9_14_0_2_um_filter_39_11 TaxID=1974478 RepID=A0A2M8ESR9_9BACT|nr:MAG: Asp-tRNA(Asn)/Glu-tRNA(Gln) amidotransferase GatCAB subunit A [Candidatus Shapirobacteria bacterium CG_4_9_14_0_2_um_filter_39_11]
MELHQLTIKEAQERLRTKKFSSLELVKSCLGRIKKLDSKINAFITVCEKEALEGAKKADKIISHQSSVISHQSLLGIPIAVKDIFCTKGIKTTAGSKVLEDYIPVYDSTVVKRLKDVGAIILGKTNMDAWAHGSSGENSDFGATRNPWDFEYVPGGSSSGSAAALAADMALLATGTDTGGSIRLPASFCSLVGLKPTYGRVSRYGIIAMASSLDSIGHFTKNIIDSAIILNITAGQDSYDATTPRTPVPDYTKNLKKGIKGLKIGIPKEYFIKGLNKEMEKKVKETIKKLEKLGARLVNISLPHTEYALAVYYIIQPSEVSSNLARYDGIRFGFSRDRFADEARRRIMLGTYALSAGYYEAYYLKAMQVRSLIKKDFDEAFQKVDVLMAPVSPTLPFKLGEKVNDPLQMYLSDIFTVTANLAGIPGLSIPIGFIPSASSGQALPVGIQILGPQFSEELLFQVGYAYEEKTQWYKRKPEL